MLSKIIVCALQTGAEFIEIFETGSQDGHFQQKSFLEELEMAKAAKVFKEPM